MHLIAPWSLLVRDHTLCCTSYQANQIACFTNIPLESLLFCISLLCANPSCRRDVKRLNSNKMSDICLHTCVPSPVGKFLWLSRGWLHAGAHLKPSAQRCWRAASLSGWDAERLHKWHRAMPLEWDWTGFNHGCANNNYFNHTITWLCVYLMCHTAPRKLILSHNSLRYLKVFVVILIMAWYLWLMMIKWLSVTSDEHSGQYRLSCEQISYHFCLLFLSIESRRSLGSPEKLPLKPLIPNQEFLTPSVN